MACDVKVKDRIGTINPIFTCQPAGAQFASIGIRIASASFTAARAA